MYFFLLINAFIYFNVGLKLHHSGMLRGGGVMGDTNFPEMTAPASLSLERSTVNFTTPNITE